MRIRFYLDEDVPVSFAEALTNRGVNVITTQDAGNKGNSDHGQITYATNEKRVLLTHNKIDFIKLHNHLLKENRTHFGIIVSDQLPIGILLRRTMKLWFTLDADEMNSKLEFLSNWR